MSVKASHFYETHPHHRKKAQLIKAIINDDENPPGCSFVAGKVGISL
jgi:hypothetical protein